MRDQVLEYTDAKKHSVRYDAPKDDTTPVLTSAYFSKAHLPQPYPRKIVVRFDTTGSNQ